MPLTVKSYVSDGSVLLAFDMPQPTDDFAGFAIQCLPKGAQPYFLKNRLSLTESVHAGTDPADTPWTDSDQAPFQKFYWMHFPETVDQIKQYDYEITAMYFQSGGGGLKKGDSARCSADFSSFGAEYTNFSPGFTRGYLSSQAYATKFKNALIRPNTKTKQMDYDTKPFEPQYAWLGYSARKLVFNMLNEALQDKTIHIDLFAYDLDEPDFIKGIIQLGKEGRLRAFLDNASLHTKKGAVEIDAHKAILAAAGSKNVVQGCFKRFAHCKVMVARRNGTPFKVFTGSANFSVRGLYVQANNCFVINDPKTAGGYGQAFDVAFKAQLALDSSSKSSRQVAGTFAKSPIAAAYLDCSGPNLPKFKVAFSPHTSAEVSLGVVADAVKNAKSSVIFSVMQLGGGGDVMNDLNTLDQRRDIFSYGMTQSAGGVKLFSPGSAQHGAFAAFSYLKGKVPPPFDAEYSGGGGIVIHDKFVVVDFNGDNPAVFTGSSNLAGGGEEANGDSLLAIYDSNLAKGFAVEGIRLVDHYHFRMMQAQHPSSNAITLQGAGAGGQEPKWWQAYYTQGDNKYNERLLFSQGHAALVAATAAGSATATPTTPATTGTATTGTPSTGRTQKPAAKPSKSRGGKKPKTTKKAKTKGKSARGKKKPAARKKSSGRKKAGAGRRSTAGKRSSSRKRAGGTKKARGGKKKRATRKPARRGKKK